MIIGAGGAMAPIVVISEEHQLDERASYQSALLKNHAVDVSQHHITLGRGWHQGQGEN